MTHRALVWLAVPMLLLMSMPLVSLIWAAPTNWLHAVDAPIFWPALRLSLWTTVTSMGIVVLAGTPLAWWLARGTSRVHRMCALLVDIPIILPPAVLGLALLETFGRSGLLSSLFEGMEMQVPFTSAAVVIAQVVVASPFYIHSATAGFRTINHTHHAVAMTLGARPWTAFLKVSLPMARPSILSGLGLAWARALGEFGATLIFAGNLSGETQTMPLAIYAALDQDIEIAIALSLILTAIALVMLLLLRARPIVFWNRGSP